MLKTRYHLQNSAACIVTTSVKPHTRDWDVWSQKNVILSSHEAASLAFIAMLDCGRVWTSIEPTWVCYVEVLVKSHHWPVSLWDNNKANHRNNSSIPKNNVKNNSTQLLQQRASLITSLREPLHQSHNKPFYSCLLSDLGSISSRFGSPIVSQNGWKSSLLSDLAYEWQRSYRRHLVLIQTALLLYCKTCCFNNANCWLHLQKKSKEVCIKTRSLAKSLPCVRQVA